jgi:uncharacterized protein DUF7008/Eco57I restriction-modification methylase
VIDRSALLKDLQQQTKAIEASLHERLEEVPAEAAALKDEHATAKKEGRTGDAYTTWLDLRLSQVASSWVLATVFVRFLEDNELGHAPRLAGPGENLQRARDAEIVFFREHPELSQRELLEDVFRSYAKLPALERILGEGHNPLWLVRPTANGAKALLEFWRRRDPDTGKLIHDFTDPARDTRFLGDLYQDLSELIRKRYALLQTPDFVERFILDRTLDPAIEEFGLENTRLIDPACGSGHFLLGAFERFFKRWVEREPGTNLRELAQRALRGVSGVDLNPFAIAIARFRLVLAALEACEVTKLAQAPGFELDLAAGDSLLHGPPPSDGGALNLYLDGMNPLGHLDPVEDPELLRKILGRRYQAVVANPPYITPKDKALRDTYREIFHSCHMKYSLAVPFKERCFDLAAAPSEEAAAGFIGLITANSFMKREFGKKLIEDPRFMPAWDLTHVIDTSGAYIPGHGTPTVILFGRSRKPVSPTIRAVRGIRGEPSTPEDPALGEVWTSILDLVDQPGGENEFVSSDDVDRKGFGEHPWSLTGGGAAELKHEIEQRAAGVLGDLATSIGITSFTLEDDIYVIPEHVARRQGLSKDATRPMITGDLIRDWSIAKAEVAVFPYDREFRPELLPEQERWLWLGRTNLANCKMFGSKTKVEAGLGWFEFGRLTSDKLKTPLTITFAFVATHNHFVLDRGGKVFKQSAPVIKLPPDASEDDHLALLGLLNSSVACFWMKQVFYPKGTTTGDISTKKGVPENNRYEIAGTGLKPLPIPAGIDQDSTVARISACLDQLAQQVSALEPAAILAEWTRAGAAGTGLAQRLEEASRQTQQRRHRMVVLQEELDWECYRLFGLTDEGASEAVLKDESALAAPEQRPFESEPQGLPTILQETYARRARLIGEVKALKLVETRVYKRLWLGQQGVFGHASSTYEEEAVSAQREWLQARLETLWASEPVLQSAAQLADLLGKDQQASQVAEVTSGRTDFDLVALIRELLLAEAVPAQDAFTYKTPGLRKRKSWQETWRLQRVEDALEARGCLPVDDPRYLSKAQLQEAKASQVGKIPVPPKFKPTDFRKSSYWSLRGKLDVPKERFISFPGAERDQDPTPVFGWAGWDHLQRAQAIAAYYLDRKEQDGWEATRLTPLLVALYELLPWLKQWHNEFDPDFGTGLGDYYAGFVEEEARSLELTLADLENWDPPKELLKKKRTKKKRAKKKATKKSAKQPEART